MVLYGLLDRRDGRHAESVAWYRDVAVELVTTPLVLAEVDHLATARAGPAAVRAFRDDVRAGAYLVEWWRSAVDEAIDIAGRYADLAIGLTDASLVALAARVETTEIATFDERHFRGVRPLSGPDHFTLLPADAGR